MKNITRSFFVQQGTNHEVNPGEKKLSDSKKSAV